MHHYNQTHSIVRNTKNEIRWYLRACVCVCVPEIVGLFLLLSGFLIKRFALITWWHEQTLYPIDENYFDIWNQYQSIYIDIDKSSEFQCEFNLIPYNGQQNQKKGKKRPTICWNTWHHSGARFPIATTPNKALLRIPFPFPFEPNRTIYMENRWIIS